MVETLETIPKQKYTTIAEHIEREILTGVYPPGDKLPPERALSKTFDVSPLTLRHSLRLLADRGLIRSHHGKGNFVTARDQVERYVRRKREALSREAVAVLGFNVSGMDAGRRFNPANLITHLLRYQGMVEATFMVGAKLTVMDLLDGADKLLFKLDGCRGVILQQDALPEATRTALRERDIPAVSLVSDKPPASSSFSAIRIESRRGVTQAMEHLIADGRTRIAFLGMGPDIVPKTARYDAYREALEAAGLPVGPEYVIQDPRGLPEDGAAAMERLAQLEQPPDAVFASSDFRALGALRRALELGFRVPDSLRIVGYDDIPEASMAEPQLSTVFNPLYEAGFEAVRMVFRHSGRAGATHEEKVLQTRFVPRQT